MYVISKVNDTIYRFESPLVLPSILGDVNIDGDVDEDDVTDFVAGWLTEFPVAGVESWMHGDLDLDGITDLPDAFLLHEALAAQGSAFDFGLLPASVPEPNTASLIAAAASVLVLVGYRRT